MTRGKSLSMLVAGAALATALAAGSWWAGRSPIPEGLAWGNGRLEAEELDVATRSAGHVDQILVEEGDLVEAGQTLARMDTAELEAELREAKAQAREAIERSHAAGATIKQRKSECDLAEAEYRRSEILFEQNVEPESRLDVKHSQLRSAQAACGAAEAQKLDALSLRGLAKGALAIVDALVCINLNGDDAAFDFNVGLANASHATDADSITEYLFLHTDGNSLNLNLQSTDGTTTVASTDTTVDAVVGTPFLVQFDLRNNADIQAYVNGVNVLPASVFKLDAATGPLKLLAHMEKTANDSPGNITIMRLAARGAQV